MIVKIITRYPNIVTIPVKFPISHDNHYPLLWNVIVMYRRILFIRVSTEREI